LSYVVVDENDPAFLNPTKPIGPALAGAEAKGHPYPVLLTEKGYRRVVASPRPVTIVEKNEIRRLIEMDFIVICCGGGGIPVIREGRGFAGVDAVIDKDLASATLAKEVGVDIFCIATDVEGVALNYGKRGEKFLRTITTAEARRYMEEGHFENGTMLPKMEAALQFLSGGGRHALITSIGAIERALEGSAGTEIVM
jgi:carbamate kinase